MNADAPLARRVVDVLARSVHINGVELRGSRASGTAGRFSDWDFVLWTDDFRAVADELPALVDVLDPLVKQWDRLSDTPCYMLILRGPVKVDLIFEDIPHDHAPPWKVDPHTLPALDDHFWDWVLWLTSKVHAGKHEFVATELNKMHEHLLMPMGVEQAPASLHQAVSCYLEARTQWEQQLGTTVDRTVERQVSAVLDELSGS